MSVCAYACTNTSTPTALHGQECGSEWLVAAILLRTGGTDMTVDSSGRVKAQKWKPLPLEWLAAKCGCTQSTCIGFR